MRYRELGRTGLIVSEIGFGGEWMDGTPEEARAVVDAAEAAGVNILDCWMPDPTRRSNLGDALAARGTRGRWVIQGHLGSTWQGGQYVRTRDLAQVRPAFEDLLARFPRLAQVVRIDDGLGFRSSFIHLLCGDASLFKIGVKIGHRNLPSS